MAPVLRLFEDTFSDQALLDAPPPAMPRMVLVVHGTAKIDGRALGDGETWHGEGTPDIATTSTGFTAWRFELAPSADAAGRMVGRGVVSREKISASLSDLPAGELLLRGDSVDFPPAGCAYLHRHQGPGIRCLIEGGIRIDTHGRSTSYGPGGAWFETGPDPVFAQAAADRATRFIRVMVLPRALLGKSSIQYINEEDKAKPKTQQYRIFVDAPIARP
jgi:hypothetical protein